MAEGEAGELWPSSHRQDASVATALAAIPAGTLSSPVATSVSDDEGRAFVSVRDGSTPLGGEWAFRVDSALRAEPMPTE